MTIDRRDYENLYKRQTAVDTVQQIPNLRIIERDALDAEYLTNDHYWDKFLTVLQATKQRLEAVCRAANIVMCHPRTTDHASILHAKIEYLTAQAQVELLDAVMALPKDMMANGTKATEMLEKIGTDDGSSAA